MFVPSQPPDPPNRNTPPGESPPRPPTHVTGPKPTTDPSDQPQDLALLAEEENGPPQTAEAPQPRVPRLGQPPLGKRLNRTSDGPAPNLTAEQRLLLLDTWRRSGLPAADFAALVGLFKHTLYAWMEIGAKK